ncbi:hypothetical protein, partial [Pseudomonas aeruginosa]
FAPTLADKAILPTAWGGRYFFNRIGQKRPSAKKSTQPHCSNRFSRQKLYTESLNNFESWNFEDYKTIFAAILTKKLGMHLHCQAFKNRMQKQSQVIHWIGWVQELPTAITMLLFAKSTCRYAQARQVKASC